MQVNKQYVNGDMVDRFDAMSEQILSSGKRMYIRENFFASMIDKSGFKIGVEIGVDVGDFSHKLLSKCQLDRLYGIDCWSDGFGSDFRPGFYAQAGCDRYSRCRIALNEFVNNGRSHLIKGKSVDVATKFDDSCFDFVYIDGDHSMEMLFDLYAWTPKVKLGGVIAGHDFKCNKNSGIKDFWGEQFDYAVQPCAEYYTRRFGHKLNVVGGVVKSFWFVRNR